MKKLFTLLGICFIIGYIYAQNCPTTANITSNGFCLIVVWDTPPSPLPVSISVDGVNYPYNSGAGTIGNPAEYKNGGGGGACNAGQNGITGTVSYNGTTCTCTSGTCSALLPIQLVRFDLSEINDVVRLNWETASEINNDVFEIERSNDGKQWERLSSINGSGTTNTPQHYSFVDDQPFGGLSYYRLKQIDYNDAIEYSPVRSITRAFLHDVEIRYQRGRDLIEVAGIPVNEAIEIRIVNLLGSVKKIESTNQTHNKMLINTTHFQSGIYLVEVIGINFIKTQKILIS